MVSRKQRASAYTVPFVQMAGTYTYHLQRWSCTHIPTAHANGAACICTLTHCFCGPVLNWPKSGSGPQLDSWGPLLYIYSLLLEPKIIFTNLLLEERLSSDLVRLGWQVHKLHKLIKPGTFPHRGLYHLQIVDISFPLFVFSN